MPRAEPALSLAPPPLPAVVGAAIRTGITTPVTPSGPPPQSGGLGQGVLPTGGCAGTTTLRLPPGKAQGPTWRYGTLTATALRARTARRGGVAGRQATVAPTMTWAVLLNCWLTHVLRQIITSRCILAQSCPIDLAKPEAKP